MKAIQLIGDIDQQHRLHAEVPAEVPPGPVRLIVLPPDEDAACCAWAQAVAGEWVAELSDTRQDIYTLDDGEPMHALW